MGALLGGSGPGGVSSWGVRVVWVRGSGKGVPGKRGPQQGVLAKKSGLPHKNIWPDLKSSWSKRPLAFKFLPEPQFLKKKKNFFLRKKAKKFFLKKTNFKIFLEIIF